MPGLLASLTFLSRTALLVMLILLYAYFHQSTGRLAQPIRLVVAGQFILLIWVWTTSLFQLVAWIHPADLAGDFGMQWVWIPNSFLALALARLLFRLYSGDFELPRNADREGGHDA